MNVLDDEAAPYLVLGNAAEEYSLWPAAGDVPVPGGWRTVFGPAARQACLAEIGRVWVDRAGAADAAGSRTVTAESATGGSASARPATARSAGAEPTAATGSGGPR